MIMMIVFHSISKKKTELIIGLNLKVNPIKTLQECNCNHKQPM